MSVNIPAIPTSVDFTVRQAIAELAAKVIELQKQVANQGTATISTTTTVINSSSGIPDCPPTGLLYLRKNNGISGSWEVLDLT